MTCSPSSRLFALIIGIDEYQDRHITNLRGAVSDADSMTNFLRKRVPSYRIRNLRNEDATRERIITELKSLATHNAIKQGDPILIFYAGHGGQAVPPEGWSAGGGYSPRIQMLLPYDFDLSTSNIESKQGIPDLTLAALLSTISRNKGDNITVILDSCFAGSGTRNNDDQETLTRGIDLSEDYVILDTTDHDLLRRESARADQVALGHEKSGLWSHTLLAACRADQRSNEVGGHGLFTTALLEFLRHSGPRKVTYEGLIQSLPDISDQNPQCEGVHKSRFLFTSKAPDLEHEFHTVRKTQHGSYELDAGEAIGISLGAEFAVCADTDLSSQFGLFIVTSVTAFIAELEVATHPSDTTFPPSGVAYALQICGGRKVALRVSIPGSELLSKVKSRVQAGNLGKHRVVLIDANASTLPDLVLMMKGDDTVAFGITQEICRTEGLTQLYHSAHYDPFAAPFLQSDHSQETSTQDAFTGRICNIISSAAHFHFYLTLEPAGGHFKRSEEGNTGRKVRLECFELDDAVDMERLKRFTRVKDSTNNLIVDGVLDVSVTARKVLGFRIVNETALPFYASMFYFDASDLSVVSYYQPNSAKGSKSDYSIPARGELTVGYGSGGGRPRRFHIRTGQTVEVAFLKVFLSTHLVDYSRIEQPSPFESDGRAVKQTIPRALSLWDTICIPVIQRE